MPNQEEVEVKRITKPVQSWIFRVHDELTKIGIRNEIMLSTPNFQPREQTMKLMLSNIYSASLQLRKERVQNTGGEAISINKAKEGMQVLAGQVSHEI